MNCMDVWERVGISIKVDMKGRGLNLTAQHLKTHVPPLRSLRSGWVKVLFVRSYGKKERNRTDFEAIFIRVSKL